MSTQERPPITEDIKKKFRTYKIKNGIYRWQKRLGDLKETLMLYALPNQFLQQVIEGDELYTKVDMNKGSQSHKRGRKRRKYQDPQPEHPETIQNKE